MQDELVELETRLEDLDRVNADFLPDENFDNGSFRKDEDEERRKIVSQTIPEKLLRFSESFGPSSVGSADSVDNFVNSYAQLVNKPALREQDRQQVEKWFKAHPRAIDIEEARFIEHYDDLVAVHPKARSWFRTILEWTFVFKLPIFRREPGGYELIRDEHTDGVVWSDEKRLESFCTAVVAVIGLGMLIGPLWILNVVQNTEARLGVITGFIALFFVLVAVATNAKVFESLAAAAAYSAVLMVFLQLGAGSNAGTG